MAKKLDLYYQTKSLVYGMSKTREEKLLEILGKNIKGKKILELGCSTGYFGTKLKKFGGNVVGVDISKKAINEAKKVLDKAIVLDLNEGKLPFSTKEFDIVIAAELIEHLFQPQNLLNSVAKIIKDEGVFILTTPNLLYWGNRLKFLKGEFVYQKSGVFDEGHVHFYTHKTLENDIGNSGFKIIKENHVFAGTDSIFGLKNKMPGIFAYQFVIVCQKKPKTN